MKILFALFLCIDAIILLMLGYEAFVVKSNKKRMYRRRFTALLGLVVAALVLSFYRFNLALLLAGAPAVGVSLFALLFFIAMITHKGPWH
jgi:hypothetical protein